MALPTWVAAGTAATGISDITPSLPSGWAVDDIFILCVETGGGEAITTPSGWAEVAGSPQTRGIVSTGTRLGVFYRRAQSGDTDPTITDSGDHTSAVIVAIRGCVASGNPVNAGSGSNAATASAVSFPAVTTTSNDCLIVNIVSNSLDSNASTALSGWTNASLSSLTERYDQNHDSGGGGGISIATGGLATAGDSGATTATLSVASQQCRITIALLPQSAIQLGAAPTSTTTATGALTTAIQVIGASANQATASGSISTGIALAGVSASVVSASGVLTAQINLDADALAVLTASGGLSTSITLSGSALAEVLAAADLAVPEAAQLAGGAQATASAAGSLITQIPLAGSATAVFTSSAGLTTAIALTGASASTVSAMGGLTLDITLSAAALATVSAGGVLTTQIPLMGSAINNALAIGALTTGGDVLAAIARWTATAPRRSYRVYRTPHNANNWSASA